MDAKIQVFLVCFVKLVLNSLSFLIFQSFGSGHVDIQRTNKQIGFDFYRDFMGILGDPNFNGVFASEQAIFRDAGGKEVSFFFSQIRL